eukprot:TRINITY_DN6444_c0_g1_i1.p1 TRINITY_DN6444_c0_g1~~TRINITY_DN6444_c0_g1_i1.p1  ORF type:complete len:618 (+),score=39.29 TRINITY_DN6444_c0_g1_i1:57-1910(+)
MAARVGSVREVKLPEGWKGFSIESTDEGRIVVTEVPKSCFSSAAFEQTGARPQIDGIHKNDEIVTVNGFTLEQLVNHIGMVGGPLNACGKADPPHAVGDVRKTDLRPPCASCDFLRRQKSEGLGVALSLWIRTVKQEIPITIGVRSAEVVNEGATSSQSTADATASGSSDASAVKVGKVILKPNAKSNFFQKATARSAQTVVTLEKRITARAADEARRFATERELLAAIDGMTEVGSSLHFLDWDPEKAMEEEEKKARVPPKPHIDKRRNLPVRGSASMAAAVTVPSTKKVPAPSRKVKLRQSVRSITEAQSSSTSHRAVVPQSKSLPVLRAKEAPVAVRAEQDRSDRSMKRTASGNLDSELPSRRVRQRTASGSLDSELPRKVHLTKSTLSVRKVESNVSRDAVAASDRVALRRTPLLSMRRTAAVAVARRRTPASDTALRRTQASDADALRRTPVADTDSLRRTPASDTALRCTPWRASTVAEVRTRSPKGEGSSMWPREESLRISTNSTSQASSKRPREESSRVSTYSTSQASSKWQREGSPRASRDSRAEGNSKWLREESRRDSTHSTSASQRSETAATSGVSLRSRKEASLDTTANEREVIKRRAMLKRRPR